MKSNNHKNEIDKHTGVETTGHEWDDIKELNNPAPRWWLWVFFITCIWAFGYWVVYPTWPTLFGGGERGGTKGSIGWTQYNQLKEQQTQLKKRKDVYLKEFQQSSFEDIMNDPELYAFAVAGGKAAFKDNCTTCHGTGGTGTKGYPNLNDDDWLWGGTVDSIYNTVKYGVRSNHESSRNSQMPAFASLLSKDEVNQIANYVLSLSKNAPTQEEGMKLYSNNCASCHGPNGKGNKDVGAPNLTDNIWLWTDANRETIAAQIKYPKHGIMPNWDKRLDEQTIRQLTIYIHSLGGGE